jgi:hypothetical protein
MNLQELQQALSSIQFFEVRTYPLKKYVPISKKKDPPKIIRSTKYRVL